jgi:hypothetical protein
VLIFVGRRPGRRLEFLNSGHQTPASKRFLFKAVLFQFFFRCILSRAAVSPYDLRRLALQRCAQCRAAYSVLKYVYVEALLGFQ